MNRSVIVLVVSFLAWLVYPIVAATEGIVVEPIQFPRGTWQTTVSGGVIRGERSFYSIGAQAGQRMTLNLSSVESNAVFQLYEPGAHLEQRDYGIAVAGHALAGAAESDDATEWSGTLPHKGMYLVCIGPTRGNATYRLRVEIH